MKIVLTLLILLSTQMALASDAFQKKCIELGGEAFGHGSCILTLDVENKQTNPNWIITPSMYEEEQKGVNETMMSACTDAALGSIDAIMPIATNLYNNNTKLRIVYNCFIAIR